MGRGDSRTVGRGGLILYTKFFASMEAGKVYLLDPIVEDFILHFHDSFRECTGEGAGIFVAPQTRMFDIVVRRQGALK